MRNYESKLVDSSRIIADMLVIDIGSDPERFQEMLSICLRDKYPLSMRASRIVALCTEKYPHLINDHIDLLIQSMDKIKVEGVRRGFLKIFAEQKPPLTEDQTGYLTDLAFRWLGNSKEAIAVRYYCILILLRVCENYPELRNELVLTLRSLKEDGSPGLQSISKQVLRKLEKSINANNNL